MVVDGMQSYIFVRIKKSGSAIRGRMDYHYHGADISFSKIVIPAKAGMTQRKQ